MCAHVRGEEHLRRPAAAMEPPRHRRCANDPTPPPLRYKVEGLKALADAIKVHNTIEVLNLGMTQICGQNFLAQGLYNAKGLLYLVEALKFSSCLKQIDLR